MNKEENEHRTKYDEYGSYDGPKKFRSIKPLKEVIKISNRTTKKINTGPSLYYDWYGSYDRPKKCLPIKPLKEVKKIEIKKCVCRGLNNEENEYRTHYVL